MRSAVTETKQAGTFLGRRVDNNKRRLFLTVFVSDEGFKVVLLDKCGQGLWDLLKIWLDFRNFPVDGCGNVPRGTKKCISFKLFWVRKTKSVLLC